VNSIYDITIYDITIYDITIYDITIYFLTIEFARMIQHNTTNKTMSYCNNCWSIYASEWQSDRCCQAIKNKRERPVHYRNDNAAKSDSADCGYFMSFVCGLGLLISLPHVFLILVLMYFYYRYKY
jgi:hypothetical protein